MRSTTTGGGRHLSNLKNTLPRLLFFWGVAFLAVIAVGCDKEESNALPGVTSGEVTSIKDIEADVSGTVTSDGGMKIVALGVCWKEGDGDPTVEDRFVAAGTYTHNGIEETDWTFTATLTGLQPKKIYKVRAYAANENGVSYGETRTFETKAGKTFHTLTPEMIFTYTQEIYEGFKENLVDGSTATFWHSAYSGEETAQVAPLPHYIQITFPEAKGIGGFQYWHRSPSGTGGRPTSFDVQTSTDGNAWTTVWVSPTNLPITILPPQGNTLTMDKNYTSRYFRIRILTNYGNTTFTYLSELKVFHDGLLD